MFATAQSFPLFGDINAPTKPRQARKKLKWGLILAVLFCLAFWNGVLTGCHASMKAHMPHSASLIPEPGPGDVLTTMDPRDVDQCRAQPEQAQCVVECDNNPSRVWCNA